MNDETRRAIIEGKMTKEDIILNNTEKLCESVDNLGQGLYKIIYAVLGLLAGVIGLKFIGTPWYVDLMVLVSLCAAIFVIAFTCANRKYLAPLQILLHSVFGAFTMFSSIVHIYVYQPTVNAAPKWFSPTIDLFLTVISVLFIVITWRTKIDKGRKNTGL